MSLKNYSHLFQQIQYTTEVCGSSPGTGRHIRPTQPRGGRKNMIYVPEGPLYPVVCRTDTAERWKDGGKGENIILYLYFIL